MAEEILAVIDRKAVLGFAYTRPNSGLIINSVRETREDVRLAGGDGDPVRVLIVPLPVELQLSAFPNSGAQNLNPPEEPYGVRGQI
jgi:hypothetical protein